MKPSMVNKAQLSAVTSKLPMFKSMHIPDRDQVLKHARIWVAQPEETIIEMGVEENFLYVLLAGKATVHLEEEGVSVADVNPGDLFGEMGFILNVPRNTWVIAQDTCILLRIDHQVMGKLTAPIREKIKDHIIEKLAKSLTNANENLKLSDE